MNEAFTFFAPFGIPCGYTSAYEPEKPAGIAKTWKGFSTSYRFTDAPEISVSILLWTECFSGSALRMSYANCAAFFCSAAWYASWSSWPTSINSLPMPVISDLSTSPASTASDS
jgi:hypothetical protein